MKTTLEERLATASANMKLTAHKAFKHPVSSILSLCVLGVCAATLVTFSQPSSTPVAQDAATAENVMPVGRTLTSADGRTIDVVITAKTSTGIKAKKADGKEFELTLDKLSDTDRAFVATLMAPPVKKLKVLFIRYYPVTNPLSENLINGRQEVDVTIEKLTAAGFEIHTQVAVRLPHGAAWPEVEKMSDQQIKDYDVVWEMNGPRERLLPLIPTYQGVMVMKTEGNDKIKDFLADRIGGTFGTKPHVKVDDNLVRYNTQVITWTGQTTPRKLENPQPEFIDQAIAEVQKLLNK